MNARLLGAGVLLPLVTACQSLQPVSVRYLTETNPAVVYLSDGNGVVQAVAHPRLSGDTVLGTAVGGHEAVAVPLHDVQRITTVRVNRGRTVMLVGGITAAGGLLAYAVLSRAAGDGSEFCDYDNQPTGPGATECGYHSNP